MILQPSVEPLWKAVLIHHSRRKGGGGEKKLLASCTSPGRREAGALGSSPPELCSTIGLVVDFGVPKPDVGSGHGDGHHSVERVGVLRLFLYPKGS